MKSSKLFHSISMIFILVFGSCFQIALASSGATLKTWYYLGMSTHKDGYVNLGSEDRAAQGFQPPIAWTISKVSIYSEYAAGVEGAKTQTVTLVHVEIRSGSPEGQVLASGSTYVSSLGWYDVSLSANVALSPGNWYYIVAYSQGGAWNYYYHNDGHPNDDGPAGVKRYGSVSWQPLYIDFLVRYYANFFVDSTRLNYFKTLSEKHEPILKYDHTENYYPCDFYFDKDMNIANNPTNYDNWRSNPNNYPTYDARYRVFIHIEDYVFFDSKGLGPMIAIEYWHYYANDPKPAWPHPHDWELHCVIFLNRDTEAIVLVGMAQHLSISYYDPSAIQWSGSHPICHIEKDGHASYPSGSQSKEVTYSEVLNIYVFDTSPCTEEYSHEWGIFCKITNWEGYHVTWPYGEGGWLDPQHGPGQWWAKYYGERVGNGPWHRYTWDEPTTGNPGT